MSKDNLMILDSSAIERWNLKTTWKEYKKTLTERYANKYPDFDVTITQGRTSTQGLIDYIVWGAKKEACNE